MKNFFIFILLFVSHFVHAQKFTDNNDVSEFYKIKMLEFLIEKGLYSNLGEEYVYENYNIKTILLIREVDTKTFGIKAYRFSTSEEHSPVFFMLGVEDKYALILGVGKFMENLCEVIKFTDTYIKEDDAQLLFMDAILEDFVSVFKKSYRLD